MLAPRIIKKISDIPKGNFRSWFNSKDLAHSSKYQWDEVFVNVCYHRANHEWTNEQYTEIQTLLKVTAPDLRKNGYRDFFEYVSVNPFFYEKWLSGSQYLIDDFPAEMDWMREKNSHFEETKSEITSKRPVEEPTQEIALSCFDDPYGLLGINTSNFPSHHTWWKNKSQRSRFRDVVDDFGRSYGRLFTRVFRHRLVYYWKKHEYKHIHSLLRQHRQELADYCRRKLIIDIEDLYSFDLTHEQEWLSGLQFLFDDFPNDMSFLTKEYFDRSYQRMEKAAKESPCPYDNELMDALWLDPPKAVKRENEILVVNWATKPAHHIWWQIKVEPDYDSRCAFGYS